ncbi:hypothetical protein Tco_0152422 [Tanacetum coccineum]
MSDVERADMGSQAEASSSSKRDMGSYISTMKPSDVKALTRKYKIPRDLHPVAVSSEWTMDRLTMSIWSIMRHIDISDGGLNNGVLGNREGNFDDDVDEEVDLEGPDRHVSDTTEKGFYLELSQSPLLQNRRIMGSLLPRRKLLCLIPFRKVLVPMRLGLLYLRLFLFRLGESTRGADGKSSVTTTGEPGFPWPVEESLVRTREDFNVVQNFYNTLSERHRKLREEHAQCSEGLAVVRAEKDMLDDGPFFCCEKPEAPACLKDSALVYAERISGERLSENEELRAQLSFAQKEKTDAIRKLLPTVVERLLQSHEYKQSLSVPFNYALQTGWGQGLAEERSEKELHKIMMKMNGFDPYSDKKIKLNTRGCFSKDAPQASFEGIVFAPRLFRAAEVARSKDTTSLQDPSSKNASEGSKALPSKKT